MASKTNLNKEKVLRKMLSDSLPTEFYYQKIHQFNDAEQVISPPPLSFFRRNHKHSARAQGSGRRLVRDMIEPFISYGGTLTAPADNRRQFPGAQPEFPV
ncbi:MAG: hypothetical protein V4632_11385 [Pseudomonadota bacterium]